MTSGIYDDMLSGFNNGSFPIFSLLLKIFFFSVNWSLKQSNKTQEASNSGFTLKLLKNYSLKNKYNLTLCQSHLHNTSETFVHHNFFFWIRSKHFESFFNNSELPYKRIPKPRMVIVKFHSVSQHRAL